ncbi:MAG: apolipoprotein N-acyltransferase [Candidatus Omnitrophica bacterium]|nr:apolipoprotein N-acyltransferase [Candidatus Omnitrophota bacterium]
MLRKVSQSSVVSLQLSAGILNSILSGALLTLAFSNGKLWIFSWFAFVPLFLTLNNKSLRQTFFLFFITGIVFWLGTVYWLVNVTLIGTILLILYLALYFAIFGLIIRPYTRHSRAFILLFIPSVWVLLEYSRSRLLSGFPWALLGYSQYLNLPVIQIADITGIWGVSFLIMLVNVVIIEIIWSLKTRLWGRLKIITISVILLFSLILSYGYIRLASVNTVTTTQGLLRASVIQGNIPQALKWEASAREFVMNRYFNLTSASLKDTPDLIIWPEASLPVVLEEEPLYYARLVSWAKTIGRSLIFGAVTNRDGLYYNSALLLSKEGELQGRYDKLHLVPFGEYIPFRGTFSFLETIAPIGDISRGKKYTLFNIRHQDLKNSAPGLGRSYQFGVLICFEDIFPELARGFVNRGADFLVNITNDAWFGRTSEAYQHLAASVFRAVENRVHLVRAANTGVSGFIDPAGKAVFLIDREGKAAFTSGYKTGDMLIRRQFSFYGRYGDLLIPSCLLFLLYIAVFKRSRPERMR